LDPRLEQDRVREFSEQLKARIESEEKLLSEAAANGPRLEAERAELEKQGGHLADAIAQRGGSPFLSAQLARVDSRLAKINGLLTSKPAKKLPSFTDLQIREFLYKECKDFCELLKADAEIARQEIEKQIKKLVLTPKETTSGTVLEVSGDGELLRTGDVLDESPLEGIAQHYIVRLPKVVLDPSSRVAA